MTPGPFLIITAAVIYAGLWLWVLRERTQADSDPVDHSGGDLAEGER